MSRAKVPWHGMELTYSNNVLFDVKRILLIVSTYSHIHNIKWTLRSGFFSHPRKYSSANLD